MAQKTKPKKLVEKQNIAEQIMASLRVLAAKKVPEPAEFYAKTSWKEWDIRKYYGGWTKLLDKAGLVCPEDPELSDLKSLKLKLAQLKQENTGLKSHIGDLEKDTITSKVLKEMIGAMKDSDISGDISWLTPKKVEKTKGVPVLFLSDIHFDEVVSPDQIQGLNEFDREICTQRLQHTFNKAIYLLKSEIKDPRYDGIVLALGGDLFSGNIHEELAETNEASILQSVLALLDILIVGITKLEKEFGRVFVPCVVGNHGRLHKKPRCKNRVFDNYEWILYQFLARHFVDNKNVTFQIPDGADCQFKIYDKSILLTHGDQFRGGSGISGIFTPLMLGMSRKQKRSVAMKNPFDLMMCGHFHQLIMTPSLLINGSVKGYDEYAFMNNFGFEPPQQALFVVHPREGITHQMPVLCEGYKEEGKALGGSVLKAVW